VFAKTRFALLGDFDVGTICFVIDIVFYSVYQDLLCSLGESFL